MVPTFTITADIDISPFDYLSLLVAQHGPSAKAMIVAAKVLRAALLCLAGFVPLHATSIIAARSQQEIVIAIDGRITGKDDWGSAFTRSTGCKLVVRRGSVYATAGLASLGSFNIFRAIESVKAGSLGENVAAVRQSVFESLVREISSRPSLNLDIFIRSGKPLVRIFVAGVERKHPSLYMISFTVDQGRQVTGTADSYDGAKLFTLAPDSVSEAVPKGWADMNLVVLVRKLMQMAIRDSSSSGPPISIVRITSTGLHWVSTGACKNAGQN